MKNGITYEIKLPRGFRVADINIGSIPIDENWEVTVRESHRNIGIMPLKVARKKFG